MQRLHEQPTASEFAQLSRGAPFFSALMVGLAVIAYLDAPSSRTVSAGVLEPTACGLWDKKAVEGITPLLYEDSAVTDLKLNEAFTQLRRARALFPMYDTPFQFVVLSDAGAQTVADLAGKQVGIGPQGGTGGVYTPLLFRAINTAASFVTGSWTELAAQLAARKLDALVVVAGVPVPEVTALERQGNIRNLTLTPSQRVAVRLALPEIAPSIIAAGTYPSLRRNYQTVGMYNFAVARADLPDDLVQAILDAVFDHPDEMMEIHPAAAETVPSNFSRNTILPFHDGAARWYNNKATIGVVRGD